MSPDREEPHNARALLIAGDLKDQIEAFFDPYRNQWYHDNLNNITLYSIWLGRNKAILQQRERNEKGRFKRNAFITPRDESNQMRKTIFEFNLLWVPKDLMLDTQNLLKEKL